eukprot:UN30529
MRSSETSTRISLFACGCSFILMMVCAYETLVRFVVGGFIGNQLRKSEGDTNIIDMSIPESITDLYHKYGLDTFSRNLLATYFTIFLIILPIIAIALECLWRLISGMHADDPKQVSIVRTIRNISQMFYFWDIFCLTLYLAAWEMPLISTYLEEHMIPEACKKLQTKSDMKCYTITPYIKPHLYWLTGHTFTYFISVGLPVLYRALFVVPYFWCPKRYNKQEEEPPWEDEEILN